VFSLANCSHSIASNPQPESIAARSSSNSPRRKAAPHPLPNPPGQLIVVSRIPFARRRLDAPSPLRLWHLTSLDAPTVAAVWSLAFAWAAGIRLPAWVPILLALAAWTVYIADRLLDARAALRIANLNSLRERHLFHYRHRRLLVPVAIAAACAAMWIVFTQMPSMARERNSVLALAALAYFSGVHSSRRLPPLGLSPLLKKELLVGLLFTAACALPAFSRAAAQAIPTLGPLSATAVFFAMLAWLNCHAIDRWEAHDGTHASQIFTSACLLSLTGLLLATILSSTQPRFTSLVLAGASSALLLTLLDRHRSRLTPLALRAAADLVLLTPLLLLLR
jgi:hypothetical protein